MSITNRDAYERTLQITEGSDNQVIYNLLISADETIDGLCKKSCSVLLDNGIKQSFEGYEQVYIFNGRGPWSKSAPDPHATFARFITAMD
jgi:hypothetical protein